MAAEVAPSLIGDPHCERRPAAVDHRIGELGCDNFAAQPMLFSSAFREMPAPTPWGNSVPVARPRIGIIGAAQQFQQFCVERKLGVGQNDGKLRPGKRLRALLDAVGDHNVVRQELDPTIKLAALSPGSGSTAAESPCPPGRDVPRAITPASAGNCCAAPARRPPSVILPSNSLRSSSESLPSRTGSLKARS